MNTFQIVPSSGGFKVVETSQEDCAIITRYFKTEAAAQIWIVKRATAANMADLAQWLRGRD
jgi:hypothetical protein